MADTATPSTPVTGHVSGADLARHRQRSRRAPSVWASVSAEPAPFPVPARIATREDLLLGFATIDSTRAARMLNESLSKSAA